MSTHKVRAAVAVAIVSSIMACSVCDPIAAGAWSGDSYKSWLQKDPSWSGISLGTSSYTVGNSGCVVTAAAMLMIKSGSVTDPNFSPASLVRFFNANGGFSEDGDLDLARLSRYAPSFRFCQRFTLTGTKQQKAEEMQRLMDEGYYLMAVVRNGAHYVAIDSVRGSEVIMMDPGSGATNLFVQYPTGGVTELRLFRGANSRIDMPEEKTATPPAPTDSPIMTMTPAAAPAEPMEAPAYEELTPETPSYDDLTPETPPAPQETAPTQAPTEVIVAAPAVVNVTATETETIAAEPERETTPAEDTPETPPMPEDETEPEAEADVPPNPPMPADDPQEAPDSTNVLFKLNGQKLLMKVRLTAAKDLVLYAAPDQKADHLLIIPAEGELDIVEADSGFRWGKAAYAGKTGWIDLNAAGL